MENKLRLIGLTKNQLYSIIIVCLIISSLFIGLFGFLTYIYLTIPKMPITTEKNPVVIISSPLNKTYADNNTDIVINAINISNYAIDRIWYNINNLTDNILGNTTYINQTITPDLNNGKYILNAYANDTLNNIGINQVFFTINYTLPQPLPIYSPIVIIGYPLNKTYIVNSTDIVINAINISNYAIDKIWYSIKNTTNNTFIIENITYTNATTTPILSNGLYIIYAYANDTLNNIGFSKTFFTINYTKPTEYCYKSPFPNQTNTWCSPNGTYYIQILDFNAIENISGCFIGKTYINSTHNNLSELTNENETYVDSSFYQWTNYENTSNFIFNYSALTRFPINYSTDTENVFYSVLFPLFYNNYSITCLMFNRTLEIALGFDENTTFEYNYQENYTCIPIGVYSNNPFYSGEYIVNGLYQVVIYNFTSTHYITDMNATIYANYNYVVEASSGIPLIQSCIYNVDIGGTPFLSFNLYTRTVLCSIELPKF